MAALTLYTLDEVAKRFRISRRKMQDVLRDFPFYTTLGRKKLFSEEDVQRLYGALRCRSNSSRRVKVNRRAIPSVAPTSGSALTEALALATKPSRGKSSGSLNATSNVEPFPTDRARRSPAPPSHT